jgi:hypothetical protein
MKKSLLAKLLLLLIVATNLSGCIILPGWYGDGRGHHHGEYREGHRGHDDRY